MSDATEQALSQAYELIEADRLSDAEALLKPILEQDPDNVDAWWLYAHAVSDPETARMALNQILRLDSSYEGAGDLLSELEEVYPAQASERTLNVPAVERSSALPGLMDDEDINGPDFLEELDGQDDFEAVSSFSLDDDDFSLDDLDDDVSESAEPAQAGQGSRLIPILVLLVLVAVIVAIIVIVNPFSTGPAAVTPTQDVQQAALPTPTMESVAGPSPIVESTAEATDQVSATDEPAGGEETMEAAIYRVLQDFDVVPDSITLSDTSLGNTLLVTVCSAPGAGMRETLSPVMEALATASASVTDDVSAIGATLSDCADGNRVLRVIAVPVTAAAAYRNGDISNQEFQGRWSAVA